MRRASTQIPLQLPLPIQQLPLTITTDTTEVVGTSVAVVRPEVVEDTEGAVTTAITTNTAACPTRGKVNPARAAVDSRRAVSSVSSAVRLVMSSQTASYTRMPSEGHRIRARAVRMRSPLVLRFMYITPLNLMTVPSTTQVPLSRQTLLLQSQTGFLIPVPRGTSQASCRTSRSSSVDGVQI